MSLLNLDGHFHVFYPSGRRFELAGRFFVLFHEKMGASPMVERGNQVFILDPRAIVTWKGRVVYTPREFLDDLHPEMQKWLREHPGWAS